MKAAERGRIEADRALLQRLQAELETGRGIRSLDLTEEERKQLAAYQFVTALPVLLVVNIGEGDVDRTAEIEAEFATRHGERRCRSGGTVREGRGGARDARCRRGRGVPS